jgi:hypothetical protein
MLLESQCNRLPENRASKAVSLSTLHILLLFLTIPQRTTQDRKGRVWCVECDVGKCRGMQTDTFTLSHRIGGSLTLCSDLSESSNPLSFGTRSDVWMLECWPDRAPKQIHTGDRRDRRDCQSEWEVDPVDRQSRHTETDITKRLSKCVVDPHL